MSSYNEENKMINLIFLSNTKHFIKWVYSNIPSSITLIVTYFSIIRLMNDWNYKWLSISVHSVQICCVDFDDNININIFAKDIRARPIVAKKLRLILKE